MPDTQTLSVVKWETVGVVPVGSWTFMRDYIDPNDDETFTINEENIETLEKEATDEEKTEFATLLTALKQLYEENGETFISIS